MNLDNITSLALRVCGIFGGTTVFVSMILRYGFKILDKVFDRWHQAMLDAGNKRLEDKLVSARHVTLQRFDDEYTALQKVLKDIAILEDEMLRVKEGLDLALKDNDSYESLKRMYALDSFRYYKSDYSNDFYGSKLCYSKIIEMDLEEIFKLCSRFLSTAQLCYSHCLSDSEIIKEAKLTISEQVKQAMNEEALSVNLSVQECIDADWLKELHQRCFEKYAKETIAIVDEFFIGELCHKRMVDKVRDYLDSLEIVR